MLDPRQRDRSNLLGTGRVWATAQPWRPDPEAERASGLAEDRLRELRPDVMERYDRLRAHGTEPVEAMRRVAPFFDRPAARTGQPGPDRAALAERDTARRAGDAELVGYRRHTATSDDPRTSGVDEPAAAASAAPHLARPARGHTKARAATAPVLPTPAVLAGAGYPAAITAAAPAAVTAGSGRGAAAAQHRAPVQPAAAGRRTR